MRPFEDTLLLRVRYSETDQMGTFYNSRALEWFECARTESLRKLGLPYTEIERRGVFLPLVEAHLQFRGRARYDDLLRLRSVMRLEGRARLRVEVEVCQAESGAPVVSGYTIHAFTEAGGRPVRPPGWFIEGVEAGARLETQVRPPRP